ncbi:MAG TPA: hypothetical protein VMW27_12700 [Thermoanaerobaculia bacterium]|nr:hypothetical protein [Thermoanaerobaculia bacterium]
MPKKSRIERTVVLRSLRAGLAAASTLSPRLAGAGAARLFLSTRRHPMAEWERARLASAHPSRLASPWGELVVWAWGPEGAPAVALQHGWEGRGRSSALSCRRWSPRVFG